jgi:large repetitive protein
LADNQELIDSGTGTWSIRTGATFVGTDVNDKVTGTDGHDNIQGGGGHDWIDGGAGQDTLLGGAGNDTLLGGAGDDRLLDGGTGDDVLDGGLGNDILIGGDGDDVLLGGAGNDTLTGGAGKDIFSWQSGHQGTAASPAVDHVTDFNKSLDVLDISDLLDHDGSKTYDQLKSYLSIGSDTSNVTIEIHDPAATQANASGAGVVEKIVLDGVHYSDLTGGSNSSAADVLNHLLTDHLLNIDK